MGSADTDFKPEELAYYSRQLVLADIGLKGQRRLKQTSVLVAGLGGLGCQLAVQLASMGVGHLRLIDRDIVEMSNLQRQNLYGIDVVGYPKVEAAKMRLSKVNPFIEIEALPVAINDSTASKLVEGIDLVVDGLDRLTPRLAVNRACIDHGIPYIYGAVITHVGNVSTILPGETPCLECWQGSVDETKVPTCATVGVTPSVISIVASIQVSEAIRIILGKKPNLASKLLFFDLEDLSLEIIKLAKSGSCSACGEKKVRYEKFDSVEEICGREGKRVFTITPAKLVDLDVGAITKKWEKISQGEILQTRLGVSFSDGKEYRGSIFKTGVAVFEGIDSKVNAIDLYKRLTGIDVE
jgi:molybdopterin/thiamine biosynthesis adenylyltransferase